MRKRKQAKEPMAAPMMDPHMPESVRHERRKIKNGWIHHVSQSGPQGYKDEETFYPHKPELPSAPSPSPAPTKKPFTIKPPAKRKRGGGKK